jgi:hypothetical protein
MILFLAITNTIRKLQVENYNKMKKVFTFLSLLAAMSSGQSYAQSFTIAKDTAIVNGNSAITEYNNITIPAGSAVGVQWAVISTTLPTDLMNTIGVCDNATCFGAADVWPTNYRTSTYPAGATGDFHVTMDLSVIPVGGPYILRIRLRNAAITTDTAIQTYIINRTATTSVNNVRSAGDVTLYPNPATSSLNVLFDAASDIKSIAVYNIIGKQVSLFRPTDNAGASLNIENIPSGIYFVRLMNSHGDVVTTRKFTKQ